MEVYYVIVYPDVILNSRIQILLCSKCIHNKTSHNKIYISQVFIFKLTYLIKSMLVGLKIWPAFLVIVT